MLKISGTGETDFVTDYENLDFLTTFEYIEHPHSTPERLISCTIICLIILARDTREAVAGPTLVWVIRVGHEHFWAYRDFGETWRKILDIENKDKKGVEIKDDWDEDKTEGEAYLSLVIIAEYYPIYVTPLYDGPTGKTYTIPVNIFYIRLIQENPLKTIEGPIVITAAWEEARQSYRCKIKSLPNYWGIWRPSQ